MGIGSHFNLEAIRMWLMKKMLHGSQRILSIFSYILPIAATHEWQTSVILEYEQCTKTYGVPVQIDREARRIITERINILNEHAVVNNRLSDTLLSQHKVLYFPYSHFMDVGYTTAASLLRNQRKKSEFVEHFREKLFVNKFDKNPQTNFHKILFAFLPTIHWNYCLVMEKLSSKVAQTSLSLDNFDEQISHHMICLTL